MTTVTQKIPSGYKQAEIGVIPVDWDVKGLGSICKYQNGTSLERYFNQHDGYKVISIGNYSTSGNYIDTGSYISFDLRDRVNKFILNKDDLTMILNDKTSTGEIIGRVLLIEKSNCYVFNQRTMRLTSDSDVLPKYLYFLINSSAVHKKLARQAKPGTQIYFNTADILDFKIGFPKDKTEQSTIIDTLSDADILIKKLEKLIEKKKNIKQGVMQELLTGKRRLTGFTDKWELRRLDDIFRVTRGQVLAMTKTTKYKIGDYQYPVYSSQTKENGLAGYYKDYLFENCITWTTDGANAGDVKYRPGKFYCTNVCGVLESNEGYANLCIAYIFNSVSRKYVSYIGNPKLMNNVVADIAITIPSSIKEQVAISEVISDMDTEIEKLESQLTKYQNIKQGMMQTLLTGKIRLLTK